MGVEALDMVCFLHGFSYSRATFSSDSITWRCAFNGFAKRHAFVTCLTQQCAVSGLQDLRGCCPLIPELSGHSRGSYTEQMADEAVLFTARLPC